MAAAATLVSLSVSLPLLAIHAIRSSGNDWDGHSLLVAGGHLMLPLKALWNTTLCCIILSVVLSQSDWLGVTGESAVAFAVCSFIGCGTLPLSPT